MTARATLFSDEAPSGQGFDAAFSAFEAFCLALAVDLLDTGFNQSELVFLFRHIRPQLKTQFDSVTARPIPLGNVVLADEHPDLPSFQGNNFRQADFRVFVMIQKVELKEAYPNTPTTQDPKCPFIFQSVFCRGIEALQDEINKRDWSFRKALILELATPAELIRRHLDQAPLTRIGTNR